VILGLQDVYYYVTDMRRAVTFYRDLVGLRLLSESDHWSVFDLAGVRLGLHAAGGNVIRSSPDGNRTYAGATVTLKVRDIRREVERLQRVGIRFVEKVSDEPFGTVAAFVDPDGNVVKLMEPS
jgi:predicted enzyme related to lactoylglutathione lyase